MVCPALTSVCSLELSKKKYDMAKSKVKSLSEEFRNLKAQLQEQVSNLQSARSNLVSQISSVQDLPVTAAHSPAQTGAESEETDRNNFVMRADEPQDLEDEAGAEESPESATEPRVDHLRYAASAIASAGATADAAESAQHALHYTEQVASRVGDLADQSEEQAERIVDAARLTQV